VKADLAKTIECTKRAEERIIPDGQRMMLNDQRPQRDSFRSALGRKSICLEVRGKSEPDFTRFVGRIDLAQRLAVKGQKRLKIDRPLSEGRCEAGQTLVKMRDDQDVETIVLSKQNIAADAVKLAIVVDPNLVIIRRSFH